MIACVVLLSSIVSPSVWICHNLETEPPRAEMPQVKRPASAIESDKQSREQRESLHRELVQCSTLTGLVDAMTALSRAGELRPSTLGFKPRQLRQELTKAKKLHSQARTPYGTVVQTVDVPSEKHPKWEICHPLAMLHYLATLSTAFFDLMSQVVAAAPLGVLRLVLYIDEVCPGNPLRHDKGRTLQALYWCFAEWPAWLLARTGAWCCLGVLRSSIVKDFPGGISQLMTIVLRCFFPRGGRSIRDGLILTSQDGRSFMVKAEFGGFLGDEKALKEINDSKGASGASDYIECSLCI